MEKHKVEVNGLSMACYKAGEGNTNLLFLHGNSLDSDSFLKQLNDSQLQREFTMYAPDLIGYGDSDFSNDPEKDYVISEQAKKLAVFCKKNEITDVIVVGHSLGGNIAIELLKCEIEIKGIVLTCSYPASKPLNMSVFLPSPVFPLFFKPDITASDIDKMNAAMYAPDFPPDDYFKQQLIKSDPLTREYLAKEIEDQSYTDQFELINQNSVPTAMIYGGKELLYNLDEVTNIDIPLLGGEVHVIPHCGHVPFYEDASNFKELLVRVIGLVKK